MDFLPVRTAEPPERAELGTGQSLSRYRTEPSSVRDRVELGPGQSGARSRTEWSSVQDRVELGTGQSGARSRTEWSSVQDRVELGPGQSRAGSRTELSSLQDRAEFGTGQAPARSGTESESPECHHRPPVAPFPSPVGLRDRTSHRRVLTNFRLLIIRLRLSPYLLSCLIAFDRVRP